MTLYEEIIESENYKSLIKSLSKEELDILEKHIRDIVDKFENNILVPLKNIK